MTDPEAASARPAPCLDLGDGKFAPRDWVPVVELVRAAPLAWIVSPGGGATATPLPLRPKLDAQGRVVRLDGHFARSNPQLETLRADPLALVLFSGVQGYISPSWFADRTQAPTWTYATVQFHCELELFDAPARVQASLRDLIDGMEAGRPNAWSMEEMGARFDGLARGVVAFEARVLKVEPRFKLGQDERQDVLEDLLSGLASTDQSALKKEIVRMNIDRLEGAR